MTDQTENKRPEDIESDIQRTRADFSSTIEAIQTKLTPSELANQAVDYALNTTPGTFGVNLVNSVRDNPLPVALIGVGVAWLLASNRQAEDRAPRGRYPRAARRAAYYSDREVAYDGAYGAERYAGDDTGDGMLQRAASKTSGAATDLKNRASGAASDLKDKASDVSQRLSDKASTVAEQARRAGARTRDRLQDTAEDARDRMSEIGQRSRVQYYRAKDRFDRLLDEQPIVVGAVGVAIGAALGATLPTTRRENELMGRTRDQLLERAKETTRKQAETVKQSAQRVAQVAKDEAEQVKENVSNAATQGTNQPSTRM